jgi:DNA-binding transcriptional LysR family regulator
MELRHLRYFTAVASLENISRAAARLHVSQPALSRQIRDLEDELGFPLLQRTARSVQLTAAGRVFFDEAKAVLARVDQAVAAARVAASGQGAELHIGYAQTPTLGLLPPTLRLFQERHPRVRVRLHDLATREMLGGLRSGLLQLAFLVGIGASRWRGLRFEPLGEVKTMLAVSPGHRWARRRTVRRETLSREPLISLSRADYPDYHEGLEAWWSAVPGIPRPAEEHDSIASLLAAVEAGIGVAIVAESLAGTAGARVRLIPLDPAPEPLVVGAAWPVKHSTPAAAAFLACAREVAGRSGVSSGPAPSIPGPPLATPSSLPRRSAHRSKTG